MMNLRTGWALTTTNTIAVFQPIKTLLVYTNSTSGTPVSASTPNACSPVTAHDAIPLLLPIQERGDMQHRKTQWCSHWGWGWRTQAFDNM